MLPLLLKALHVYFGPGHIVCKDFQAYSGRRTEHTWEYFHVYSGRETNIREKETSCKMYVNPEKKLAHENCVVVENTETTKLI